MCCNVTFICISLVHSCIARSGGGGEDRIIPHVSEKVDESLAFSITLTQVAQRLLSIISRYRSRLARETENESPFSIFNRYNMHIP